MEKLIIGAHTSAAGGVHNALIQGKEIGATTVQLFTSNQKRWQRKPLDKKEVELWFQTLDETGLQKIMSHDSYLINLGAPDPDILRKSRKTFREEAECCVQLGISFLNFHPGSAIKDDPQHCLDRIAESLLGVEDVIADSPTMLLLETTAGQGSSVGHRFEQIAYIIGKVDNKIPIGVCVDTCHIFAAGYDVRNQKAWDTTLDAFDRVIGMNYLKAFHVNDSLRGLGSRIDRHQPLGEGEIGLEGFKVLMQDPRIREIPKYLETPGGPGAWVGEIQLLRQFAKKKS